MALSNGPKLHLSPLLRRRFNCLLAVRHYLKISSNKFNEHRLVFQPLINHIPKRNEIVCLRHFQIPFGVDFDACLKLLDRVKPKKEACYLPF